MRSFLPESQFLTKLENEGFFLLEHHRFMSLPLKDLSLISIS